LRHVQLQALGHKQGQKMGNTMQTWLQRVNKTGKPVCARLKSWSKKWEAAGVQSPSEKLRKG